MTTPEEPPLGASEQQGFIWQNGLAALMGALLTGILVRVLSHNGVNHSTNGAEASPALPPVSVPPPPPVPRRKPPLDTASMLAALLIALVGAGGFIWLEWQARQRLALVPNQDIPAYTILRPNDLPPASAARFRFRRVSGPEYRDSAHGASELLNRYTRAPLPAGKPVSRSLLAPADTPVDTVAMAVPAADSLLLGGTLRPGDRVDLLLTPSLPAGANGKPVAPTKPVAFLNITVLDARRGGESLAMPGTESAAPPRSGSAVLILALPSARRNEFAALLPRSTLLLTLRR